MFKYCIYSSISILSLLITVSSFASSCHNPSLTWLEQMRASRQSTVLLQNDSSFVPVIDLDKKRFASVNIGSENATMFDSIANKYTTVDRFSAEAYSSQPNLNSLSADLKLYNAVIVQVSQQAIYRESTLRFLQDMERSKQLIVVLYSTASTLAHLDSLKSPVIWSASDSPSSASFTAQLIFGGTAASSKLPATVSPKFKAGDGFHTATIRLSYTVPEELGINSGDLERPIDNIVRSAIAQRVTPGAVVMVVKDGRVIFDKAYGSHTYEKKRETRVNDIFDLASVSKIAATTIASMRLYEQNKLSLDSAMGYYLPLARETNKKSIPVRDLMLHQAGLVSYIPFHNSLKPGEFSRDSSDVFPIKVADNYYIKRDYYNDVMLPKMLNSGLRTPGKYVYSDLSMYFMKEIIERQASEPMDQYVQNEFYKPLGMKYAGFAPRLRFDKSEIVPTEKDTYFRKTLIEGYVHDQGAALAGGVAGHAGLFSSANDLAILFQMMLNGGIYGGKQYFQPSTIDMFTSRQSNVSRRGLGFDRWDPDPVNRYPSELASPQTYGHTGFTGTCVWVDPKSKLIYIFLSNRLYEQPANKLSSLRVRPKIQDAIYQAINKAVL
ncbi:CubicO group peptidase (beta-lactamase class C family) [Arcticibacter pallidicorallinus]|uniref:CubicO group peptidase (Beta-lactamase class C family) n=1 Tax=Arcticibacter pallidicorallinus TaxID=1259464 RepID=A0A2T0TT73_9SPHI|nr:serine hydrolase [Arcticibacter pallidicorallinus]PRY48865.1 CubicO group peptidase (beta-lactamase class C family) [Arcticibacter pallidicorallinus]